jgi:hypothetical protein
MHQLFVFPQTIMCTDKPVRFPTKPESSIRGLYDSQPKTGIVQSSANRTVIPSKRDQ